MIAGYIFLWLMTLVVRYWWVIIGCFILGYPLYIQSKIESLSPTSKLLPPLRKRQIIYVSLAACFFVIPPISIHLITQAKNAKESASIKARTTALHFSVYEFKDPLPTGVHAVVRNIIIGQASAYLLEEFDQTQDTTGVQQLYGSFEVIEADEKAYPAADDPCSLHASSGPFAQDSSADYDCKQVGYYNGNPIYAAYQYFPETHYETWGRYFMTVGNTRLMVRLWNGDASEHERYTKLIQTLKPVNAASLHYFMNHTYTD